MNQNGILSLILPVKQGLSCIKEANEKNLYVNRSCTVYPKPEKKAHRILLEISNNEQPIIKEELIIENHKRHNYTKDYKNFLFPQFIIHTVRKNINNLFGYR